MRSVRDLEGLKKAAWKHGELEREGPTNRFCMRPISIRITYLLMRTRVRATHVTLLSFFVAVVAAVLFTSGAYLVTLAGAIVLYFANVLDGVDGEIARAKKQTSNTGAALEYFLDRLGDIAVYSGLIIGLSAYTKAINALLAGAFALVSTFFMNDIVQRADYLKEADVDLKPRHGFVTYLQYGGSSNTIVLLLASIVGRIFDGLILIGLLSFAYGVARFVETYVAFSRLKAKRR